MAEQLANGELLTMAEQAGFDVKVTSGSATRKLSYHSVILAEMAA